MPVSKTYNPQAQYNYTTPLMMEEPNIQTWEKRLRNQRGGEIRRKLITDALGPSAWLGARQTFGYRWCGEDTLNWGELERWIQINWFRHLLEKPSGYANVDTFRGYNDLQRIIESPRLYKLGELYSFRNAAVVQHFLKIHSNLIEVLLEAYPYLEKHFRPNLQIELEVVNDSEVPNRRQLFAYIITSVSVDEGLSRLNSFDNEWFLDQLDRIDDLFNFDIEFV